VSADGNTLQGQLKNVFMNNDFTITPSENWVSMGTLTKRTTHRLIAKVAVRQLAVADRQCRQRLRQRPLR